MLHANYFRFYLARHTPIGFRSVNDLVANVKRVETAFDADITSLLSQFGLENLVTRINADDAAFKNQTPNSLDNCRSAVRRYDEFRQWRLAQQHG